MRQGQEQGEEVFSRRGVLCHPTVHGGAVPKASFPPSQLEGSCGEQAHTGAHSQVSLLVTQALGDR